MERDLLMNAIINYSDWCEAISKTHRIPTQKDDMIWFANTSMPSYFPDIISLVKEATLPDSIATANTIFDSFNQFSVPDFSTIFHAQWITSSSVVPYSGDWRWIHDEEGLENWSQKAALQSIVLPTILEDQHALFFYKDDFGGFAAYHSHDVMGITAVFGDKLVRQEIPAVLANFFPDFPVVGFDAGEGLNNALHSGWTALGPLNVWTRNR